MKNKAKPEQEAAELCQTCGSVLVEQEGKMICPNCDAEIDWGIDEDGVEI